MDITVVQKYVRISPKKMRVVAEVVKKMSPVEAVEKMQFIGKHGSEVLGKVVKSALINAKQKGLSDDTLIFKEIQIGEGPRLKRGRAASRGRWHPIKKRMSHVRVVLTTRKLEALSTKSETGDMKGAEIAESAEKENNKKTVEKKMNTNVVEKTTENLKNKMQALISKKGAKK